LSPSLREIPEGLSGSGSAAEQGLPQPQAHEPSVELQQPDVVIDHGKEPEASSPTQPQGSPLTPAESEAESERGASAQNAPAEDAARDSPAAGTLRRDHAGTGEARRELREAYEAATQGSPSEPKTIELGEVTAEGAARINKVFRDAGRDLDVTGFRHTVDAYAVRHVFKGHGNAAAERGRGQVPITADDWANIPDIISNPDAIQYGRTSQGLDAIVSSKRVNGTVFYVAQVRTGRRTLAATTMWKIKE
jgi:hypothetical protein